MSFLYPAFLLGAIAIAIPIALHLMRRDVAPEVPFSAVRLLRRSPIDRTRRRRLRDVLLLAARVAALALLALAFARPYLAGAAAPAGLRIVAVDRSFSMGAPGRFAAARERADAAVRDAAAGERVAVIAFDDRADVVAAPGSESDARAAIAALSPGPGGTRFAPAIARAIELAAGGPAHLVIVSDLQQSGWTDEQPVSVPAGLEIETRDSGPPSPNVAVVQIRVEPTRVVATVANHADAPFSGTARVAVDGREAAAAPARVAAGETADVAVPYQAPRQGRLQVTVDDAPGYPADNSRYAILDPPARTGVLLVAASGPPQSGVYLARALEAAEDQAFDVRAVSGADLSAMAPESAARHAVIVLLSTRGLDRRGRDLIAQFVRGGGGLLVAGGETVEPTVLGSVLGWTGFSPVEQARALTLSASDVRHPIFRPFGAFAANLGQVRFHRVWSLNAAGWQVAARFDDGSPAIVEREEGKGRVVLFASDVDRRWNEFPLHPAFVPFAAESVRYVAGMRDAGREYLVVDAPPGAGPGPGVYSLKDGRTVAVNVDPRESGVARLSAREFAGMISRAESDGAGGARDTIRAQAVEAGQNLWQYGLVLMLAVLVVESIAGRS